MSKLFPLLIVMLVLSNNVSICESEIPKYLENKVLFPITPKKIKTREIVENNNEEIKVERKTNEVIVDWEDLRVPSNVSTLKAEELLIKGLSGLGELFVKAEEKHGVNAIFLISLARLESGNGTYRFMDRNNLFSFGAFDGEEHRAIHFDSIEEGIDFVAEYIRNEYLTEGGRHFNGYSVWDMNKSYASDAEWANKIIEIGGHYE